MGLAAPAGQKYLWQYDGTSTTEMPTTPVVKTSTYGVIKLFVTSKNQLYVGFVDLQDGFTLLRYDGVNGWTTIRNTGFENSKVPSH